jgi:hypothetical protein
VTPPATAAAPAVRPRRPLAPSGPRRVSGPARRAPARPVRVGGREAGLAYGALAALESLAQHRLLDRLIRGRTWIGIVAFALIGIVTLQLGLLKLNGGIGRALEHAALLQRENAALSIENSELAAGPHVQARAAHLGMAFAPAGALHFLSAPARADIAKAVKALSGAASAASARASEASAQTSESTSGGESSSASESTGAQSSAGSASGEEAASSAHSGEATTSESASGAQAAAGSESGSGESSTSPSSSGESETASAPATETSAGGGVQATSPGG